MDFRHWIAVSMKGTFPRGKKLYPARCIQLSTNAGDIILDPFGGGGSTFEAAEKLHLAGAFREGRIDAGVIIVPSDRLSRFLTDRGPSISDAKRHVKAARLEDSPLVLFAIEHEGPGESLAKQSKRSSGSPT